MSKEETKTKEPTATGTEQAAVAPTMTLDERIAAFNVDLKELLGKYNLALFAEPRVFNGMLIADPKVGDVDELKKKPNADKTTTEEPAEGKA